MRPKDFGLDAAATIGVWLWFMIVALADVRVVKTASDGNGGRPVYVLVPERFDASQPARVQTASIDSPAPSRRKISCDALMACDYGRPPLK